MSFASESESRSQRLRPVLFVALGLVCSASTIGVIWTSRAADAERARTLAGAKLSAFERCLVGAPLQQDEALSERVRGIELALALTRADLDAEAGAEDNNPSAADGRRDRPQGRPDPSAHPQGEPAGAQWPARCASFAEKLARAIDVVALSTDRSLDALREAIPTRSRLEMPFALRPDEAADLTAAITRARLPAPARAPDNEPAPPPLAPPLTSKDLVPLGKGKLPFSTGSSDVSSATDVLATRTLRLLLRGSETRLCALEADDAKGAYAVARCGSLPPEWQGDVTLANLEDGAPTALFAAKRTSGERGLAPSEPMANGVVIFAPGGTKALPMSPSGASPSGASPSGPSGASAFIAKDGAFMLTSSASMSIVRIGNVERLQTTDVDQKAIDTESAHALPPTAKSSVAAYGHVFWTDPPPLYAAFNPARSLWSRQVLPALAPSAMSLGTAPSDAADLRAGCQSAGRKALVFGGGAARTSMGMSASASASASASTGTGTDTKKTIRIAVAEGEGAFQGFDAEIGDSAPHLFCTPEAALVTSVGLAKERGHVVVIESRCTEGGCETRTSGSIPVPAGDEIDAATADAGVALVWKMRADQVTSPARDMAFYRLAALDRLASAPTRPLLENGRRGGMDVDHIHLIPRGPAVIVALESGGRSPLTYAVRIDGAGAASAVQVEETKW